jgi:copper chaperone CopZ
MNPAPQAPGKEITKMFRRRFLQLVTMASVGTLASLEGMSAGTNKTVIYFVKGFSCITCATGLDTMLGQQKGITSSKSTYPQGKVTVGFDPHQISEQAIIAFITDLGFTVQLEPKG